MAWLSLEGPGLQTVIITWIDSPNDAYFYVVQIQPLTSFGGLSISLFLEGLRKNQRGASSMIHSL